MDRQSLSATLGSLKHRALAQLRTVRGPLAAPPQASLVKQGECDRGAAVHGAISVAEARLALVRLPAPERVAGARIAAIETSLEPHLSLRA